VPHHYAVQVRPDPANLKFSAHVDIELDLLKPTRSVTLQAVDLEFDNASMTLLGHGKIKVDRRSQTATFTFDRMIPKGRNNLSIDYRGKIYKQASGLFAMDHETDAGPRRALYTQFEAADARRFVPSWDEPNFKATFDLAVTLPVDQMAISNMPIRSTTPLANGYQTVRFQTTPRMSTYLLSLNLGDFERRTESIGSTELGVITRKGEIAKAQSALDAARQSVTWYNQYFDIAYPLPKLDHIAAPGQSQFFGAMENWGAIFYFEHAMLLDPAFSTQQDRQDVFSVVAHETAHQWFGNLVTMAWWDDLWLNEGFASWMAARATSKFHPEWNTRLDAVGGREWAMHKDALATSHSVVQKVTTVQQATQAFDGITYSKGEAVLRMLENYVGEAAWQRGVSSYLKQHAYGNAVSHDLWQSIESVAGKPILAIARDFTQQPGVPLISIAKVHCSNGETQLDLTQSEFAPDRPRKTARHWRVPVSVKLAGTQNSVKALVGNGTAHLTLPGCGAVLVNDGQSGYFRTVYGREPVKQLTSAFASLDAIDQLGILLDSWALALGDRGSPADTLNLMDKLSVEAAPQVWSAALDIIRNIDRLYRGQPLEQLQWRKHIVAKLTPLMARLGWLPTADESAPTATLRNDLILVLGILGDSQVIATARQRLSDEASGPQAVPPTLRLTIMDVVARHANAQGWTELRARANGEKSPQLRAQLFGLLGATEDPALARQALELALTSEPGETTSPAIMRRVARFHPELAWGFAQEHLTEVLEKLLDSDRASFVPALGAESIDPSMVQKINDYARAHIPADARRNALESIGAIRERIRIRSTRLPLITSWLNSR
jgi:aminopeptidase N